jgi:hypothetical protein
MTELFQRFVCKPTPADEVLFQQGSLMEIEALDMPMLLKFLDHFLLREWYLQNLCMRIGSMTGGILNEEDHNTIQFGVKMYFDLKGKSIPRMFFIQHECSDKCDCCDIYRMNLLMQFGFESIKSILKQASAFDKSSIDVVNPVDESAFEDNGDNGDNGEDYEDGEDDEDYEDYEDYEDDEGDYGDDDDEVHSFSNSGYNPRYDFPADEYNW